MAHVSAIVRGSSRRTVCACAAGWLRGQARAHRLPQETLTLDKNSGSGSILSKASVHNAPEIAERSCRRHHTVYKYILDDTPLIPKGSVGLEERVL